jgi:pilus assembly protein Flp/PilA
MMGFSRTIRLYRAARARQRNLRGDSTAVSSFAWSGLVWRAICDPSGGEVLEFALIAGLIIIACISLITCVGYKITNKWSSVNNSL